MCDSPCEKAIANPSRLGRAHYVCPECGLDVSLLLVMLYEVKVTMALTPAECWRLRSVKWGT